MVPWELSRQIYDISEWRIRAPFSAAPLLPYGLLRPELVFRNYSVSAPASWVGPAEDGMLPAGGIFRVLICRITHSLGNTLLLTPLIRELEQRFPGVEIDVLTRNPVAPAVFGTRFSVRNVFLLPAHAVRHPLYVLAMVRRLRRTQYDLVIDPCVRSGTGRLALLLANGRFKLGFDTRLDGLTHPVSTRAAPKHAGQLPVYLLRSALHGASEAPYPSLDLALTAEERERGTALLNRLSRPDSDSSTAVIGIFANATGPKRLGNAWWKRFALALEACCANQDVRIVEIIPAAGQSLLDTRYPAYFSSDVRKLASVLSALTLFVSADCGVMHLACASGAPVVGVFNATDPEEWGPYGPADRVIQTQGLSPEDAAAQVSARLVALAKRSGDKTEGRGHS